MVSRAERRAGPRQPPGDPGVRHARIRAGEAIEVLNYGPTGVLVSSAQRLRPGQRCTVAWPLLPGGPSREGHVVRSGVGRLEECRVVYHAAIHLADEVPFATGNDFP